MSSSLAWPGYALRGAVRFIVSFGGLPGPVFRELRRYERLGCLPFGSGAAAGSDTSHLLGGFVKLRCRAGYLLRACHDYQRTSATACTGALERWADVCAGGVNQPGRLQQRVAVSNCSCSYW